MKKLTLFFALLLSAHSAFTQTADFNLITGKVVDENGEPLIGASLGLKSGTGGARTDEKGNFKLKVPAGDLVVFTYTGSMTCEYTAAEIELECKNTVVMPNGVELPETVITAPAIKWNHDNTEYCNCFERQNLTISLTARAWEYAPNPTREFVVVQTPEKAGQILVFSISGEEVTSLVVSELETRIELNNYAAGMYLLFYENTGWIQSIGKVVLVKN